MNRFTQLQGVRSDYEEKFYQPNFELLQQALQKQQTGYDVAQEVTNKMPEHFRGDREAAQAYQQQMQQQMQNVADAYIKNGIQGGNMARRAAMLEVSSAWQPGGKANNLEKNNAAIKEYEARLQNQVDSGFISPKVKAALLENQTANFKSYDGDTFTDFQGKDAAQHVEIQAELEQHAQSFAAQAESNTGVKVGNRKIFKNMGGQYWEIVNGQVEYKDEEELKTFLRQTYEGSDRMKSFIQQENDLFGTGDAQIDSAINAVAKAVSYERKSYQSQFLENKNFITPEMRARAAKEKKEEERVNKSISSAVVDAGLDLQKVPDKESDIENAKDFAKQALDEKMEKELAALRNKTGFGGISTLNSIGNFIIGDGEGYVDYVNKTLEIQRKYAGQAKKIEALYDNMGSLSPEETYKMYNSPEGKRYFPQMTMAMNNTPREANEPLDNYLDRTRVNAELIRQKYATTTVIGDVPETSSQEYKDVQKKWLEDGAIINVPVVALNGENGQSDASTMSAHLKNLGYGEFDLSDPKEVTRMRNIVQASVTQEGRMKPGQNLGHSTDIIPQGHLFKLPHATTPGVSVTLLAKTGFEEDSPYARTLNNFAAPLTNPHTNIRSITDAHSGKVVEGFGEVVSFPTLGQNAAGEEVQYTGLYAMRPNVTVVDGVAINNPKLYRVTPNENRSGYEFAEYEPEISYSPMGIELLNQKPLEANVNYNDIIAYHGANLKKQSGYARPN